MKYTGLKLKNFTTNYNKLIIQVFRNWHEEWKHEKVKPILSKSMFPADGLQEGGLPDIVNMYAFRRKLRKTRSIHKSPRKSRKSPRKSPRKSRNKSK